MDTSHNSSNEYDIQFSLPSFQSQSIMKAGNGNHEHKSSRNIAFDSSTSIHSQSGSEEDELEDDAGTVVEEDDNCMFTQHDDRESFPAFGSDVGLLTQMDDFGEDANENESENEDSDDGSLHDYDQSVPRPLQMQLEKNDDSNEGSAPSSQSGDRYHDRVNAQRSTRTIDENLQTNEFSDSKGAHEESCTKEVIHTKICAPTDEEKPVGDVISNETAQNRNAHCDKDTENAYIAEEDVEFSEATLIIQDSSSQSLWKETDLESTSVEWKGFTEDENTDVQQQQQCNGQYTEGQCFESSCNDNKDEIRELSFGSIQPGFTEDSDMDGDHERGEPSHIPFVGNQYEHSAAHCGEDNENRDMVQPINPEETSDDDEMLHEKVVDEDAGHKLYDKVQSLQEEEIEVSEEKNLAEANENGDMVQPIYAGEASGDDEMLHEKVVDEDAGHRLNDMVKSSQEEEIEVSEVENLAEANENGDMVQPINPEETSGDDEMLHDKVVDEDAGHKLYDKVQSSQEEEIEVSEVENLAEANENRDMVQPIYAGEASDDDEMLHKKVVDEDAGQKPIGERLVQSSQEEEIEDHHRQEGTYSFQDKVASSQEKKSSIENIGTDRFLDEAGDSELDTSSKHACTEMLKRKVDHTCEIISKEINEPYCEIKNKCFEETTIQTCDDAEGDTNSLSIFAGETQSIPSQFPLSLEIAHEHSQQADEIADNKSAGTDIVQEENSPQRQSKSLRGVSLSDFTNDSYYGGKTEDLQVESFSNSIEKVSIQYNEAYTSEIKSCEVDVVDRTIVKELLPKDPPLNHSPSPNETPNLSYPQDYLKAHDSNDINDSMISKQKSSSGMEMLSITPHSQILLEPECLAKKPIFTLHDKAIYKQSSTKVAQRDDDIDDSSDDENYHSRKDSPLSKSGLGVINEKVTLETRTTSSKTLDKAVGDQSIEHTSTASRQSKHSLKKNVPNRVDEVEDENNGVGELRSPTDYVKPPLKCFPSKKTSTETKNSGRSTQKSDAQKSESGGGWMTKRHVKIQSNKKGVTMCKSDISDKDEQFSFDTEEEDSIQGYRKSGPVSCLNDTQTDDGDDDDDDDIPLVSLRLRKATSGTQKHEISSQETSDGETEFTDDWGVSFQPSQTTQAIKSQLQKLENFDVKTLTEKVLDVQGPNDASAKKELKLLKRKNKELERSNKHLVQETESLREKLERKNDLLVLMKNRLDEYQPLLEAVQKLGFVPKTKAVSTKKSPKKKSTPSKSPKRSPMQDRKSDIVDKKIYHTPRDKTSAKQSGSIVSISSKKSKQKTNNRGNITFNNLWKVMQRHGWKHKNGPEPYNLVYVPPEGSVRLGSKLGVDFFEANDLWKKAEELGLVDSDDESDAEEKDQNSSRTRALSPVSEITNSSLKNSRNVEAVTPIVEDVESDDNIGNKPDNTSLCGKSRSMTAMSITRCALLIQNFLDLGAGHFMRNLFGPVWDCLSNQQGLVIKELGWKYCKSVRKGGDNLGREYWFCPPNSKGSKGIYGIDYFTTEMALISHILREIKTSDGMVTCLENSRDAISNFEIKLSRAIEMHIPFDEIENTAFSDKRRSRRRVANETNEVPIMLVKTVSPSFAKRNKVGQDGKHMESKSASAIPTNTTCHAMPVLTSNVVKTVSPPCAKRSRVGQDGKHMESKSASAIPTNNTTIRAMPVEKSPEEILNYSQKTVQGAEMLLQLNKSQNEDSRHEDEYMSRVTKRGIKELLKFRRRAGVKRQAEDEKKDDEEFPQKRAKMSPSSMCHLTQVTEEPNDQCFQPPPKTSFKNSRKEKLKSPLTGLFFFGSGVDDHVRKSVYSMGGTFLDDVGRFTSKNKVKLKLFFLSSASKRRTHKYVLACALGVPMLHIDWLFALKKEFEEFKKDGDGLKVPGAFDNRRYIKYRLPLGLSNESGLFHLQRASHAKHWSRPSSDNGKRLFDGIQVILCLDNSDIEKKWVEIIKVAGGAIVNSSALGKKGVNVDIILVDSLCMPPHVTATPSRLTKILNKALSLHPNLVVVDLSWATQCIVQRKLLQTDDDKRYRVDMSQSKNNSPKKSAIIDIFSIKVKQFNGLTRYEVGDSVNFGKRGAESYGRITSIKHNRKTRKNTVEVKVLELHNDYELMDGGKSVQSVTIDSIDLQGHIVVLGGRDYGDVAWTNSSNIFMQKKA